MTTQHDVADSVIIERTFNAPVGRVWKALTDLGEMRQWYFDLKEFRPEVGFEFGFTFEHKGMTYRHLCKVTESIPQKKIAYTWRYDGHEGDSLVTFELFADGDKTRLKLTHEGLETFPKLPSFARENFEAGWTSISSELQRFVEGIQSKEDIMVAKPAEKRSLEIKRVIKAPRDRVYAAWTDPAQMKQWFGPENVQTNDLIVDARPGGGFRWHLTDPDGEKMTMLGEYRELQPGKKIVFTWRWDDDEVWENHTSVVTVDLSDCPGGTELRLTHERLPNEKSRDGHTRGWNSALDKLEKLFS